MNPFYAPGLCLYPLKTFENHRFPDIFRDYRERPVAWTGFLMRHKVVIKTLVFWRFWWMLKDQRHVISWYLDERHKGSLISNRLIISFPWQQLQTGYHSSKFCLFLAPFCLLWTTFHMQSSGNEYRANIQNKQFYYFTFSRIFTEHSVSHDQENSRAFVYLSICKL